MSNIQTAKENVEKAEKLLAQAKKELEDAQKPGAGLLRDLEEDMGWLDTVTVEYQYEGCYLIELHNSDRLPTFGSNFPKILQKHGVEISHLGSMSSTPNKLVFYTKKRV